MYRDVVVVKMVLVDAFGGVFVELDFPCSLSLRPLYSCFSLVQAVLNLTLSVGVSVFLTSR